MPPRVTDTDVREIIDTKLPSMVPFITMATLQTDRVETEAIVREKPLLAAELREIERLLAAEFVTLRDPQWKTKNTDGASASYDVKSYLDKAIGIDVSGALRSLTEKKPSGAKAGAVWLGG